MLVAISDVRVSTILVPITLIPSTAIACGCKRKSKFNDCPINTRTVCDGAE
jgi:hypothetical protein